MIEWLETDIVGSDAKTNASCHPKDKVRDLFRGHLDHRLSQIIGRPPVGRSENLGSGVGNAPLSRG